MKSKALGLAYLPEQGGLPGLPDSFMDRLRQEAPALEWRNCRTEDEFLAGLPACVAALVWRFPREWLEMAPGLRLVSTPAAGKDWVEVSARPGLEVLFGSFHGELMAETVLALMLAFARGVRESLIRQAGEPWARAEIAAGMRPLRGSRAVILGFGSIGKWIGRLLKPLGVGITGVNRSHLQRPDYFANGDEAIPLAELDRALPHCDHLIAVLPGGPETAGVVDKRRLALLPAHAHVYNVGRGNAIAMEALVEALRSGSVAGAGLDVFDQEPLAADHPIRTCPNVILMPHVSAFAPNYMDLYLNELLPRLEAIFG